MYDPKRNEVSQYPMAKLPIASREKSLRLSLRRDGLKLCSTCGAAHSISKPHSAADCQAYIGHGDF